MPRKPVRPGSRPLRGIVGANTRPARPHAVARAPRASQGDCQSDAEQIKLLYYVARGRHSAPWHALCAELGVTPLHLGPKRDDGAPSAHCVTLGRGAHVGMPRARCIAFEICAPWGAHERLAAHKGTAHCEAPMSRAVPRSAPGASSADAERAAKQKRIAAWRQRGIECAERPVGARAPQGHCGPDADLPPQHAPRPHALNSEALCSYERPAPQHEALWAIATLFSNSLDSACL